MPAPKAFGAGIFIFWIRTSARASQFESVGTKPQRECNVRPQSRYRLAGSEQEGFAPSPLCFCFLKLPAQNRCSQIQGGIAQLVERQLCKLEVRGSNPLASKAFAGE